MYRQLLRDGIAIYGVGLCFLVLNCVSLIPLDLSVDTGYPTWLANSFFVFITLPNKSRTEVIQHFANPFWDLKEGHHVHG